MGLERDLEGEQARRVALGFADKAAGGRPLLLPAAEL